MPLCGSCVALHFSCSCRACFSLSLSCCLLFLASVFILPFPFIVTFFLSSPFFRHLKAIACCVIIRIPLALIVRVGVCIGSRSSERIRFNNEEESEEDGNHIRMMLSMRGIGWKRREEEICVNCMRNRPERGPSGRISAARFARCGRRDRIARRGARPTGITDSDSAG